MLKKSLSLLAGLTMAGSVFVPTAAAQEPQQVLIAECVQIVEATGNSADFHGSVPGSANNIPIKVTAPAVGKVGQTDTIQVEFPNVGPVYKSANIVQKALGHKSPFRPFVFFDNFAAEVDTKDAVNVVRVPERVDLGQAEEISGKIRYRVGFGKPIEIDVTPKTATAEGDKLDVTLKTLSFDILAAETHDGETKKASTVNCTFHAEGVNVFENFKKITDGNVLASYPVKKADEPQKPSEGEDSVQDKGSSNVEKAGVVVAALVAIAGLIAAALPFLAKIFPELKKIPGLRF